MTMQTSIEIGHVADAIARGQMDDHLREIERMVQYRRDSIARERGLRKGARVRVSDSIGHAIAGEPGVVLRVNTKTVTVKLDSGATWRIPPSQVVVESTRPSEAVMADLARKGFGGAVQS